jgi:hypothetical protein
MLVSSANSRGTFGFGTSDGSKYEKAVIIRSKRRVCQALVLNG